MRAIVIICLFIACSTAHGLGEAQSFRYSDLETLAKRAIDYETSYVNGYLSKGELKIPKYKSSQLQFLRDIGKNEVAPSYLYNKCLMTESALAASSSFTLTAQNDCVNPLINALANVKTTYNSRMWKVTSQMCKMSMERFTTRLRNATSDGAPLNLSEDTIARLASLVFFPYEYGRPTFFKVTREHGVLVLYAGLISGGLLSVAGWSEAGVVVSLMSAATSALALHDSLPHAQNDLRDLNFSLIHKTSFQKIDLPAAPKN